MKYLCNLCLLVLSLTLIQCSEDDNAETNLVTQAQFTIVQDGSNEVISYNSTDHLIFCRDFGDEMWIRLAQSQLSNGDNEPHLDIDLCRYSGAGTYNPINPQARPCTTNFGWDIWWHGADNTFANQLNSSPCQLILEIDGDILTGTFDCNDLRQFDGEALINVVAGSFNCKITN